MGPFCARSRRIVPAPRLGSPLGKDRHPVLSGVIVQPVRDLPLAAREQVDVVVHRRLDASVPHLASEVGQDGIAVPAGYDDPNQSDEALTQAAERIGYPLLVKPAAGGGGKGMRTVRAPDRLPTELAAARREAQAAFNSGELGEQSRSCESRQISNSSCTTHAYIYRGDFL